MKTSPVIKFVFRVLSVLILSSSVILGIESGTSAQGEISSTYFDGWTGIAPAVDGEYEFNQEMVSEAGITLENLEQNPSYDPTFTVWLNQNKVDGYGWPEGSQVKLTVGNPASPEIQRIENVGNAPDIGGEGNIRFQFGDEFTLLNGQTVTLNLIDGSYTKTHVITDLVVTSVSANTNLVIGSAAFGSEVIISNKWNQSIFRHELVAPDGSWMADFNVIGEEQGEEIADIAPGEEFHACQSAQDGSTCWYLPIPNIPNPVIKVYINENIVDGNDWEVGTTLTVQVDDPNTTELVDYEETQIPYHPDWNPNGTFARFNPGDAYRLKPGDMITMTNGTLTKTHEITHVTITEANPDLDTVIGTASPGSLVGICIHFNGCLYRWEMADSEEKWLADFSVEQNGNPIFDILPGTTMEAAQYEEDGDVTAYIYWVPDIPIPVIKVWVNENIVDGYEWVTGLPVTIQVDDPNTTELVDYEDIQIPYHPDWNPSGTFVRFNLGDAYHLKPGDKITMTNGTLTKTHEITHVTITAVNPDTETVSGTALPGSLVGICIHFNGCLWRWETADTEGEWLADFSVEQDGNPVFDIQPGTSMDAVQWEEDGDGTGYLYNVPSFNVGVIHAYPENNFIGVQGGTPGESITLSVDDISNGIGIDFTETKLNEPTTWDPNSGLVFFTPQGFDLGTGDIITASNTFETRILVVTTPGTITWDIETDIAIGTMRPNSFVDVYIGGIRRYTIADSNGDWLVDFSVPGDLHSETVDVVRSTRGTLFEWDEDGDRTGYSWYIPNPTFGVRANTDQIEGWEWQLGTTVTITIDDPGTPAEPDITRTADIYEAPWNPDEHRFDLDLRGEIDIQPGFLVTVSDGISVKEHTVLDIYFTSVDVDTDIVSGKGLPENQVNVWTCNNSGCINREEFADQDGNWSSNFAVPGDQNWEDQTANLRFGSWIDSSVHDNDNDSTMYGVHFRPIGFAVVPYLPEQQNPNNLVMASGDGDWAQQWEPGKTITLKIDDPSNETDWDYVNSLIAQDGQDGWAYSQWTFWIDPEEFQIQPGFFIQVANGDIIKEHTVKALAITNIDIDNDVVEGYSDSSGEIYIPAHRDNDSAIRYVNVDNSGNWLADFSQPGEGTDEQDLFDITRIGLLIPEQYDHDGDSTKFWWSMPDYSFTFFTAWNGIVSGGWPLGVPIQFTADNPNTPESPDFQDEIYSQPAPWDPNSIWLIYEKDPADIHFLPGFTLTLDNGQIQRSLVISSIQITDVDLENDIVSGIAEPFAQVNVDVENSGAQRHVTADENGNWGADFKNPGTGGGGSEILYDIKPGDNINAHVSDEDADITMAEWYVPNPYIEASANSNWVHARGWPIGTVITMTISGSEEIYTATLGQAPWNPSDPNDIVADFDLQGYDVQPGVVITATGDNITKTLTVSDLRITSYDLDADTISGWATFGAEVEICVNFPDHCANRRVTSDAITGEWTVDYADPGPDSLEIVDLQPGSNGWAAEYEADGDRTWFDWQIVWPQMCQTGDSVSGTVYFGDGVTSVQDATVMFEDYLTGEQLLQTLTDGSGNYSCHLPVGNYRIWAMGGGQSREYYEETIHENAAQVIVSEGSQQSGVNFTLETPSFTPQYIFFNMDATSIVSELAVRQAIAYGTDRQRIANATYLGTEVLNSIMPSFYWAYPESGLPNYNFNPDLARQILTDADWLDEDNDGIRERNGIRLHLDYYTSSWNNINNIRTRLYPIFVANMAAIGIEVDVHDMDNLNAIFEIPRVWDLAQFAWGGIDLNVDYGPDNHEWSFYTGNVNNAGGYSNPAADALLNSADAETTRAGKLTYLQDHQITVMNDLPVLPLVLAHGSPLSYPSFSARLTENQVHAYNWPLGVELTLTIDDPDNGSGVDFDAILTVGVAPWDSTQTFAQFELGEFTLKPYQTITLTDGLFARSTVVADLVVTNIDPDADTISGTTDSPGAQVEVGHMYCDNDGCHAIRRILADAGGNWVADFSVPGSDEDARDNETFDIRPGTGNEVRQLDDDGDTTNVQWYLPNPYFDVRANWDQIGAWEWPLGATLILEIDDPATLDQPDYISAPQLVGLHPEDPSRTYVEFNVGEYIDIQAGFEISLSDGATIKTLTVSPLSFTNVDVDNDLVYGVADPEVQLGVWACDESGCYNYHATSNSLGIWMVNMTQLSDQGVAFDIVSGTWIDSEQRNEAGDSTMFGMNVPNPFIIAFPEYNAIEGWEWPDGSTVSLTIDDPATTDISPDFGPIEGVMAVTTWGDPRTYIRFEVDGLYELKVGDVVTISDGETARLHVVLNLSLTAIDSIIDTITGQADPGANVILWPHEFDQVATVYVTADQDGIWTAGFTGLFDLVYGTGGRSEILDDEGNATAVDWEVPYNQPPMDIVITAPVAPMPITLPISLKVDFSDPDEKDDHTVVIHWGDGTSTTTNVTGLTAMAVHQYQSTGVYSIEVTVTDPAGETAEGTFQYVVIYDPNGGFVTGGGWFWSPLGAYTPDPTMTGKATFGFVSKYKKGASVPTGNTEFQFKAGNLNFQSSNYDWLVVTGSNFATFKGTGTINGLGEYRFRIWAGDGEPDTFRIKIWEEDELGNETVVYDNEFYQAIGGGNIVVHTK